MTVTFRKLLQSVEFDNMLLRAVEYGKWFVHVYLLVKQQEQSSSARLVWIKEGSFNFYVERITAASCQCLSSKNNRSIIRRRHAWRHQDRKHPNSRLGQAKDQVGVKGFWKGVLRPSYLCRTVSRGKLKGAIAL